MTHYNERRKSCIKLWNTTKVQRGTGVTRSWIATVMGPHRSRRCKKELEPFFFKICRRKVRSERWIQQMKESNGRKYGDVTSEIPALRHLIRHAWMSDDMNGIGNWTASVWNTWKRDPTCLHVFLFFFPIHRREKQPIILSLAWIFSKV